MSTSKFELSVICSDQTEPTVITNRKLIKKIPLLNREAIAQQNKPKSKKPQPAEPIKIPFPVFYFDFIQDHALKYSAPIRKPNYPEPKPEDYKEANEKGLDELHEILNCAIFLEFTTFMHCLGFVMAKKLGEMNQNDMVRWFDRSQEKPMTVEEILEMDELKKQELEEWDQERKSMEEQDDAPFVPDHKEVKYREHERNYENGYDDLSEISIEKRGYRFLF